VKAHAEEHGKKQSCRLTSSVRRKKPPHSATAVGATFSISITLLSEPTLLAALAKSQNNWRWHSSCIDKQSLSTVGLAGSWVWRLVPPAVVLLVWVGAELLQQPGAAAEVELGAAAAEVELRAAAAEVPLLGVAATQVRLRSTSARHPKICDPCNCIATSIGAR